MPDETPSCRRFSLLDALILIAALAVGLYGYRVNDAEMTAGGYDRGEYRITNGWEMLVGPGLASLTASLLIARLVPPRPSGLRRQPGFVAGCVILAVSAETFLEAMLRDRLVEFDDWTLTMTWAESLQEASFGVLIAWAVQCLTGCFKTERGWIDRSLRAVAIILVLAGIASRMDNAITYYLFVKP